MSDKTVRADWFSVITGLLPGDHIHYQSSLHEDASALTTSNVKREAELKRQRKAAKRQRTARGNE